MKKKLLSLLCLLLTSSSTIVFAQSCPTLLLNSVYNITKGQVIPINSTLSAGNYRTLDIKWTSPTSSASSLSSKTSLTPNVNGFSEGSDQYTLTVRTVSNLNLIKNGDFEQGNTGFTSRYYYEAGTGGFALESEGTYAVNTNPRLVHRNFNSMSDHTTGTGKMMIVNGANVANVSVWSQKIKDIKPNTKYVFSAYLASCTAANPANLSFSINQQRVGSPLTGGNIGLWKEFYTEWDSGTLSGNVTIEIVNQQLGADGNDFALDDISFSELCTTTAYTTVNVLCDQPIVSMSTAQTSICSGSEAIIQFEGTPNAKVTYTINDGVPQTLFLDNAGTTSISTGNLTSDTRYAIVNVKNTYTGCQRTISGQEIVVGVKPTNKVTTASNNPKICTNQTLPTITHTTIGATGIGIPRGLPSGVTPSWDSNTITISGTPTEIGVFNYEIPLTGGCGNVTATGTITIFTKPYLIITQTTPNCNPFSEDLPSSDLTKPSITLGSDTGELTYWKDNQTTIPLNNPSNVTEIGAYYIKLTNANGCSTVASYTIGSMITKPKLVINQLAKICPGGFIDLTAEAITAGSSENIKLFYYLNDAATLVTNPESVTVPGDYWVGASFLNEDKSAVIGCTILKPITISSKSTAVVSDIIIATKTTYCSDVPVQLTATAPTFINPQFKWYSDAGLTTLISSDPVLSTTPKTTTSYYVTVEDNDHCVNTVPTAKKVIVSITLKPNDVVTKVLIYSGETYKWSVNNKNYTTNTLLTITNNNCTANQILDLTVIPKPELGAATGVSICKGDTGSLTVNPSIPTPTMKFTGHWNSATDPKAYTIAPSIENSSDCDFDTNNIRNYTATTFTVSLSGTYTLKMVDTNDYDGAAYIYSGNFTPGTCSGEDTWIVGDDDAEGLRREPKMTAYFNAGVTYTLISTLWVNESGVYAGDYIWTVMPPVGGQLILDTLNYWYTTSTGGNPIGWGLSFNPVGVAGSGLLDTNTAGKTTYYVGDGMTESPRNPVVFEIKEDNVAGEASSKPTTCINTALTNITHTTTGATGIGTATDLPSGVTAIWKSNTITISGTPTTAGVYNYKIPLTGGCGNVNATGTITITSKPEKNTTAKTICSGEDFLWDNISYNTSGTYIKINNACTADQELILTITAKPTTVTTTKDICFGDSFVWEVDGKTYTASGTYTKSNDGCTADQVLKLTVGTKPTTLTTTKNICFGDSFVWNVDGKTYTVSGTYTKNNNGCTADQVLKLTVGTKPTTLTTTKDICFGDSFVWNVDGKTYTASGTYTKNNDGCTADQELKLTVGTKPTTLTITKDICFGDSFVWNVDGKTYTVSGTYTKNNNGCSADQVLKLTVGTKPTTLTTTKDICFGDSFLWDVDGKTYTASGTYTKNNNGCIAGQVLKLTVGTKPATLITTENICFGDSFVWNVDGKTYTASGTYTKRNDGCTADQELNLTVGTKPTTLTTTKDICFADSFLWDVDGKIYTVSGTYTKSNDGCTADQVLKLTVGTKPTTVTTTKDICFGDSFVWDVDGKTYTVSGTYTKRNDGCTADQGLNLTVGTKPTTLTTTKDICFADSFLWDVDGKTYTVSGTYTKSNDGCTPDQVLKLTVGTKPTTLITTENICFGDSFIWDVDGKTYTASGTYTKNNNGCTADQELNLTVGTKPTTLTTTENICFGDSFVWPVNGQTYTASGTYTKNNDGCTADQVLKLTVGTKPTTLTTTENICFGNSFVWDVDGKTYTASGTYTKSNDGCTADQVLKLEVYPIPQPMLQDRIICVNQKTGIVNTTYTLDSKLNRTEYDFEWYYNSIRIDQATSETYEANKEGNYAVIAINKTTGCVSYPTTAHVKATFPGLGLEIEQTSAFENDDTIITINVTGGNTSYEYQLDNNGFGTSNVIRDVKPGTHIITVRDTNACTDLSKEIYTIGYPKFFTPNGDGYNDTWNIIGLRDQPNTKIYIFDRYGKLLKQILPTDSGWDGTYNGNPLPASDYWFTVEYTEKEVSKSFKSHFTLKR